MGRGKTGISQEKKEWIARGKAFHVGTYYLCDEEGGGEGARGRKRAYR